MDAAHKDGIVLYGLEVDREVVAQAEQGGREERHSCRARPNDTLAKDGKGHHGVVASALLPGQEDNEGHGGSHKEADLDGAVPRVLVAPVLQRQEEHDGGWGHENESGQIQRVHRFAQHFSSRGLVLASGMRKMRKSTPTTAPTGRFT